MFIEVFDNKLRRLGVMNKFEFATYSICFNTIGTFQINAVLNERNVYLLDEDRDFYVLFDGEHFGKIEHIKKEEDSDYKRSLKITGRMALYIFKKRVVKGTLSYKGNTAGLVKAVVEQNVKDIEIEVRLENEDKLNRVCRQIEQQVTGGYVWDVMEDMFDLDKIGCSFVPVITDSVSQFSEDGEPYKYISKWILTISAGKNRTRTNKENNLAVIFSQELSNISGTEYEILSKNECNTAIVAGEGEGSERKWYTVNREEKEASGFERTELWIDARDIQSETETGAVISPEEYKKLIADRAKEKFEKNSKTKRYNSFVVQENIGNKNRLSYGIDFAEGDLVTVLDDELNVELEAQVVSVDVSTTDLEDVKEVELVCGKMFKVHDMNSFEELEEIVDNRTNESKFLEQKIEKIEKQNKTFVGVKIVSGTLNGFPYICKKFEDGTMELTQKVFANINFADEWGSGTGAYQAKADFGRWAVPFVAVPLLESFQNVSPFGIIYQSMAGKPMTKQDIGEHWFFRIGQYDTDGVFVVKAVGRWK